MVTFEKPAISLMLLCSLTVHLHAASLSTYHVRTDQLRDFKINDNHEAAFWADTSWRHRSVYTMTLDRFLPKIPKHDGNVKITIKAAASFSYVYFAFYFDYDRKAPTSLSMDIPLDGFSFSVYTDSLGSIPSPANVAFYRFFAYLSPEQGNMNYCYGSSSIAYGTTPDEDLCGEYISIDSMRREVEVKISCKFINLSTPAAGNGRAMDIRYYPSAGDAADVLNAKTFTPGDSGVLGERFFLGDLLMEPHFNDSIYLFTSPAAKEKLIAGTYHTITWGTTVQGGMLGLDYSSDNGITWNAITGLTANDDSYAWQLPFILSNDCLVRMKNGQAVIATSESFSIACPVPKLFPLPDSSVQPLFQWLPVEKATSYRILIATNASFANRLIDDTVQATGYSPPAVLPSARLFWKVSSNLDYGSFSDADSFINARSLKIVRFYGESINRRSGIYRLEPNKIMYAITAPERISIDLMSITGKIIGSFHSGDKQPGIYEMPLNDIRRNLGNGTYLLRLKSKTISQIVPMPLLH
jgi:hypothetical protein